MRAGLPVPPRPTRGDWRQLARSALCGAVVGFGAAFAFQFAVLHELKPSWMAVAMGFAVAIIVARYFGGIGVLAAIVTSWGGAVAAHAVSCPSPDPDNTQCYYGVLAWLMFAGMLFYTAIGYWAFGLIRRWVSNRWAACDRYDHESESGRVAQLDIAPWVCPRCETTNGSAISRCRNCPERRAMPAGAPGGSAHR